ncbi:MAG: hypothetical protein Q619_VDC00071G0001, partial [Veillonella dispar DORA_11]
MALDVLTGLKKVRNIGIMATSMPVRPPS